ncbi:major facilitator superfamily domain-containing protein [Pestalotiopsis sp. NC0098]|nr:major facilitator superfamily domain-containing protein [Pestalotiopsis sp. NC0098]
MQKWLYTCIIVSLPMMTSFSCSVQTPALTAIAAELQTTRLIAALSGTTYFVGSVGGFFFFAPLSEFFGRNPVYHVTFFLFTLTNLASALTPNIASLLIFRFFNGLFGAPSVANSGGSLADLWVPEERSVPFALFTAACFCGPVIAPLVGGFLTQYTGWRWNFWLMFIICCVLFALLVVIVPETYPTKRKGYQAAEQSRKERTEDFRRSLARPWLMFFREPILFFLSLYMSFIYGVLFLKFTAYPVVFQQSRGWSLSISGLSFLGIAAGMLLATVLSTHLNQIRLRYVKRLGSVPEARLPHLIPVAWLMPISLFVFAWTAEPPAHWIIPILAGVPFGFGLVLLFLGINAYLTDCYERFSASALAANALLRCIFGGSFAVLADIMYRGLGTAWAISVLGFVALALTPMPWVFYRYGPYLRSKSRYHRLASETHGSTRDVNAEQQGEV